MDRHSNERESAQVTEARGAERDAEYRKPTLLRLGAWNVFTRNGSFSAGETEQEGFFQFEVR